jgi:hypothetical protein
MFRFIPLILIITFGACSSCSEEGNPGDGDNNPTIPDYSLIQYRGRMEFSAHSRCSFSTPGSSIKLKFHGTSLFATFSADNFDGDGYSYVQVILDDMADPYDRQIIRIEQSEKEYAIVEGLSDGEHTIEIVKQNECWGLIHFEELRIPDGKLMALPPNKNRLIEFYGDSNPSGWSAWNDKDKGGDDDTEAYFSYPGFTARSLNAEWVNFSAGGYGVTDRMGSQDLTDYFDKIHIYTNFPQNNSWDFESNNLGQKPEVVVINLGANDYWNNASQLEITAWSCPHSHGNLTYEILLSPCE